MNQAPRKAVTAHQTRRRRPWLASLGSGPTAATPPAAAAFDVPTAGVPTYLVDSPARATEAAAEAVTTGAAGRATGTAPATRAGAAAGAGATGSPSKAVISASVSAVRPLRLRRACSAAIADLLHFLPCATHLATSSLMFPFPPTPGAGRAGT